MAKVLIVLTNAGELGNSGKKTGWYLPEVAHPHHVLTNAGYHCVFVSPNGGATPVDPGSVNTFKDDAVCKSFMADSALQAQVLNTMKASEINPDDYRGVMYAGGHGPMYDLPSCDTLATAAAKIYESGGVIGAVCHGSVGLVPIKLSNGAPLVKGQSVTSFTNSEENAVNQMEFMPFPLETRLTEIGANFIAGTNWQVNVQVSGRLVTGQNPASATPMAEAMVKLLNDGK